MNHAHTHLGLLSLLLFACGTAPRESGTTSQKIQRVPCSAQADCAAAGGSCLSGVCTAENECSADSDCEIGEICVADPSFGGLCALPGTSPIPEAVSGACVDDSECAADEVCDSGICTARPVTPPPPPPPSGCSSDADCPSGEVCVSGACSSAPPPPPPPPPPPGTPCASDADCVRGEICDQGFCVDPSAVCDGTNCPCDVQAQDCDAGQRCVPFGIQNADGQCFEEGDKGPGESCIEPPFGTPDSCGFGLVCLYNSENDPTGICTALCSADADCGVAQFCAQYVIGNGQVTEWGLCLDGPVPPPEPPCDIFSQSCTDPTDMCAPRHDALPECVPEGNGARGSSCTASEDCEAGLVCAALAGTTPTEDWFSIDETYLSRGGGVCRALCGPASAACPSGSVCSPVSSPDGSARPDFGVCN